MLFWAIFWAIFWATSNWATAWSVAFFGCYWCIADFFAWLKWVRPPPLVLQNLMLCAENWVYIQIFIFGSISGFDGKVRKAVEKILSKYKVLETKQKIYSPQHYPRLNDKNGDLSQRWEIRFYLYDSDNGQYKLIRDRSMNKLKDLKMREKYSRDLLFEYTTLLKKGITISSETDLELSKFKKDAEGNISITAKEAFEKVLEAKKTELKKSSFRWYITAHRAFLGSLGEVMLKVDLRNITKNIAQKFLDNLKTKVSNKTYNNYLNTLKTTYKECINRGFCEKNVFDGFKELNTDKGYFIPFSEEQKNLLLDSIEDKWLRLYVLFIYYVFARPNELRYLKIKDLQEDVICFRGEITKNRKTEFVQIPKSLKKLIEEYDLKSYDPDFYIFGQGGCSEKVASRDYYYDKHKALLERHNLKKGYSLYCWKHTGVINLFAKIKDFKDLEIIKRQCRHSSLKVTEIYLTNLGLILTKSTLLDEF